MDKLIKCSFVERNVILDKDEKSVDIAIELPVFQDDGRIRMVFCRHIGPNTIDSRCIILDVNENATVFLEPSRSITFHLNEEYLAQGFYGVTYHEGE